MSDSEEVELRRTDDSLIRKIILLLISVALVQGASFIYLVGTVVNQQDINTSNINRLLDMKDTLSSINVQTTIMAQSMTKLSATLTKVAYEQKRREPIINQAADFMINHNEKHVEQSEKINHMIREVDRSIHR